MAGEHHFFDGFFGEAVAGADTLTAPTLTIVVSGTTATATINGDAGVTNVLNWKIAGESAWTTDSRSGDGDIVVSSLNTGVRYTFIAYSIDADEASPPSLSVDVLIEVSTTGVLNSILATQADNFIEQCGSETIAYQPKGGGSRSISAIIDRNPVSGVPGSPHGRSPKFLIFVKNSTSTGISSAEVNTGGDKISFEPRIGEAAQSRSIQAVQWHDTGMMYLEVA